jgi:hypothetical protein
MVEPGRRQGPRRVASLTSSGYAEPASSETDFTSNEVDANGVVHEAIGEIAAPQVRPDRVDHVLDVSQTLTVVATHSAIASRSARARTRGRRLSLPRGIPTNHSDGPGLVVSPGPLVHMVAGEGFEPS